VPVFDALPAIGRSKHLDRHGSSHALIQILAGSLDRLHFRGRAAIYGRVSASRRFKRASARPSLSENSDSETTSGKRIVIPSRKAAPEYSPGRKPWVKWEMTQPQRGVRSVLTQTRPLSAAHAPTVTIQRSAHGTVEERPFMAALNGFKNQASFSSTRVCSRSKPKLNG